MDKVINYYWGEGCGNCKAMLPILDAVKAERADVTIRKVDTANAEAEVIKYDIMSLPTLVFLKGGVEVGKLIGLKPKSLILKKIAECFDN